MSLTKYALNVSRLRKAPSSNSGSNNNSNSNSALP